MIEMILISWSGVIFFNFLVWIAYLYSKNPSIIDGCWAISIFLCATIFLLIQNKFSQADIRVLLFWFCLVGWAMRLSFFIWQTRISKKEIDKRYLELSKNWKLKKSLGFLAQYQLQGMLAVIISLPFLFIGQSSFHVPNNIDYSILAVILVGILGESITDYQLYKFKIEHPGMVCDAGLWRYSRHPNYFFEWLIWLGFSSGAFHGQLSVLSFISPAVLMYMFVFITGPMTEKGSIKSKGEKYLNYQKRTSMIIPWFNKI